MGAAVALWSLAPAATASAQTTALVSRPDGFGGGTLAPVNDSFSDDRAVSADGRYVAFSSQADGLSPDDDDDRARQIFVRDRLTGETILASRGNGPAGTAGNGDSFSPAIVAFEELGAEHLVVAFETLATNLTDADFVGFVDDNGFTDIYVRDIATDETRLVSQQDGLTFNSEIGNGFSSNPDIGYDGRVKVAFQSNADNLDGTPADANEATDVFVRDLLTSNTERVSLTSAGAEGEDFSEKAALALGGPSGQDLVAFETRAENISGSNEDNVVVRNLTTGATVTVSRTSGSAGSAGIKEGERPAISSDGNEVAFESRSDELSPDDTDEDADVFLHDVAANTTELVSRATGAAGVAGNSFSRSPAISAAGTRVLFGSLATNLNAADTNGTNDIYLRDISTDTTTLVSRGSGGGAVGDARSESAAISGDGTVAAFTSEADNLDAAGAGDFTQVYARDLGTGSVTLVSRPSDPGEPLAGTVNLSLLGAGTVSDSGRFVAFCSASDQLLDGPDGGLFRQVFVRDMLNGQTTLASRASGEGAVANNDCRQVESSADGGAVAFGSEATNLVPGVPPGINHVYVRDLANGQTSLVSRDGNGGLAASDSFDFAIDGDGSRVAFDTSAPLVPGDGNITSDVYVRDLAAGTTTLVSQVEGAAAGESFDPSVSSDGNRIAFESSANNLSAEDNDMQTNAYVHDLGTGVTTFVSRASAGTAANGQTLDPDISGDGEHVAFTSRASNLSAADANGTDDDVYVRHLDAGTTELVSRAGGAGGAGGDGESNKPAIDADGSRVAFHSDAGNLGAAPGDRGVYVRDLTAASTTLVASAGQQGLVQSDDRFAQQGPAISGDGRCVAFESAAGDLLEGPFLGTDFSRIYEHALEGECEFGELLGGGNGGGAGSADDTAPTISQLRMSNRRFRVGAQRSALLSKRRRAPVGTTFLFKLSEDARVTIMFKRLAPGRLVRRRSRGRTVRRCVRPNQAPGKGRRCKRELASGELRRNGDQGSNRVPFNGVAGRGPLRPGRHRAYIQAVDAAGNLSGRHRLTFRVVRR
jgi:Tol biopolymer transport system component